MILVIEDVDGDFQALKSTLLRQCRALGVSHEILQAKSQAEAANALAKHEGTPVILICDSMIFAQGGDMILAPYIKGLWNTPATTWLGQIPIIIYTETPDFETMPARHASAVVHKIPERGMANQDQLKAAIRAAIRAVAQG